MQQAVSITHHQQVLRGMEHIPPGEKVPAVVLLHGFTGTKLGPHQMNLGEWEGQCGAIPIFH